MARRIATALLASSFALALVGPPTTTTAAGLDRLIAPTSTCHGQTDLTARTETQVRAMRCMTSYARRHRGLAALRDSPALDRAARHKSADILKCDEFSHEACGRPFSYWIERFGYAGGSCWSAGENVAWGTGPLGSARRVFVSWMHSPGHRRNILGGEFDDLGVALRVGTLEGHAGAHVWTQDFGGRC